VASSELPQLPRHPEGLVVNHKLLLDTVDSPLDLGQVDMVRVEVLITGVRRRPRLERRHLYRLPNKSGNLRLMPGLPPPLVLRAVKEDRTRVDEDLKPVKRLIHGQLEAAIQQLLQVVQRRMLGLSPVALHRRQMIGPLLRAVIQLPEVARRGQMLGPLLEQQILGLLPEAAGVAKEGLVPGNVAALELVMALMRGPPRAVTAISEMEVVVKDINAPEKLQKTRGTPPLKRAEQVVKSQPKNGGKLLMLGSLPKQIPAALQEKVKTSHPDRVHERQVVNGTRCPILGPLLPLLAALLKLELERAPRQNQLIGKQPLIHGHRQLRRLQVRGPRLHLLLRGAELKEEPHHALQGIPDSTTTAAIRGASRPATGRLQDQRRVRTTAHNPWNSETPLHYMTNNKYELSQSVVFVDPKSLCLKSLFLCSLSLFFSFLIHSSINRLVYVKLNYKTESSF